MNEEKAEEVQWVGQPRDSSDLELPVRGMEQGIKATLAWLAENGVKPYRFAFVNGIDQTSFRKLLAGKRKRISVEMALKIQTGTKGAVALEIWGA